MLLARPAFALTLLLLLPGCGTFRAAKGPVAGTDLATLQAMTDLATEKKILKQELELARRDGDALRNALERGGQTGVETRLAETSRELSQLRASYAALQTTAATAAASPLREENLRLKAEVEKVRAENKTLAEQLKLAREMQQQAEASLAQLNVELLGEKQARSRAEQSASAARAQLGAVLAAAPSAGGNSALQQLAKAPPAGASAELRASAEALRSAADAPAREHVVVAGDTLERIALRYYGSSSLWPRILGANQAILGSAQTLSPGMKLKIPGAPSSDR